MKIAIYKVSKDWSMKPAIATVCINYGNELWTRFTLYVSYGTLFSIVSNKSNINMNQKRGKLTGLEI